MSLVYGCSLHLFHTHESVETRNFRERPCEKTNFRSWRKWDELSILNLIETFLQFLNPFLNCFVYSYCSLSFACRFFTKIDFKSVFSAFSSEKKIVHCTNEWQKSNFSGVIFFWIMGKSSQMMNAGKQSSRGEIMSRCHETVLKTKWLLAS